MDKFLNKIILGDSLEVLRQIPDNSVDAVITDPPYASGGKTTGEKSALPSIKYAKNKVTGKPVKIFEFKDELKKYMEDLNMNPKNMERSLNVGFSGGEKKKNEILQMLVLNPKLAILDETDSGLDVDAIKTVSKGIEMFKNDENAVLIITHNNKILHSLKVDYVHVLVDGKIVATGTQELATEIEENGYSKYKKMSK